MFVARRRSEHFVGEAVDGAAGVFEAGERGHVALYAQLPELRFHSGRGEDAAVHHDARGYQGVDGVVA